MNDIYENIIHTFAKCPMCNQQAYFLKRVMESITTGHELRKYECRNGDCRMTEFNVVARLSNYYLVSTMDYQCLKDIYDENDFALVYGYLCFEFVNNPN